MPYAERTTPHPRRLWLDVLLGLALAILAGTISHVFGRKITSLLYTVERAGNVWFQADPGRVVGDMVWFTANHYRTKVHPLFVLLTYPIGNSLRVAFELSGVRAAQWLMVGISAIFGGTFFGLLRVMGTKRLDATLYSLLCLASSSTLFGVTIIETYPFGAVSILLVLIVVAVSQRRRLSPWWMVATSSLTLAYTVTNWMAGILGTVFSQPREEWERIILRALLIVTLLWGVQKAIFPSTRFFIGDNEELNYMLTEASGGTEHVTTTFWSHTMIMPAIDVIENNTRWQGMWPRMSAQRGVPGSASVWGEIGVGLWISLLVMAVYSMITVRDQRRLSLTLALFLIGQWGMHVVYGEETILYAMHYAPSMIVAVALASQTRLRWAALPISAMLTGCALANNIPLLLQAVNVPRDHNFLAVPSRLTIGGGWNGWGIAIGAGIGVISIVATCAAQIAVTRPARTDG